MLTGDKSSQEGNESRLGIYLPSYFMITVAGVISFLFALWVGEILGNWLLGCSSSLIVFPLFTAITHRYQEAEKKREKKVILQQQRLQFFEIALKNMNIDEFHRISRMVDRCLRLLEYVRDRRPENQLEMQRKVLQMMNIVQVQQNRYMARLESYCVDLESFIFTHRHDLLASERDALNRILDQTREVQDYVAIIVSQYNEIASLVQDHAELVEERIQAETTIVNLEAELSQMQQEIYRNEQLIVTINRERDEIESHAKQLKLENTALILYRMELEGLEREYAQLESQVSELEKAISQELNSDQ